MLQLGVLKMQRSDPGEYITFYL